MQEYSLIKIGDISSNKIIIDKKYVKAMNKIDAFSHIHVFYKEGNLLKKEIVKIDGADYKEGIIEINKNINGTLFDIKPYMPSEDRIENYTKDNSRNPIIIDNNYLVKQIGTIRKSSKEIYIEFNNDISFLREDYLKIYWWFSKFDSKIYRDSVTCNPPYENAPKSGVFLTRAPVRPNPIAYNVAKVLKYDYKAKRVYINNIEAFDKTPLIGIEEYSKDEVINDFKLPNYLSHWPKTIDESNSIKPLDDITLRDSELSKILKNMDNINNPKSNKEENNTLTDGIYIKNAYENNLKNINVHIPYNKITSVIGVSGSGKSSLVKDVIYIEAKRKMEYLNHSRNNLVKPHVDSITGIIPSLFISQDTIKSNSLSTVGTYTDIYDYLRVIFSLIGILHCPSCGNEIITLSEVKILDIIKKLNINKIITIDKKTIDITNKNINGIIKEHKAFYIEHNGKLILLQTTNFCYHCNKIIFELSPSTFSYLDNESRCPECSGIGKVARIDESKIVENENISILDGAIPFFGKLREFIKKPNANFMKGQVFGVADYLKEDLELPWKDLSDEFKDIIINGSEIEVIFKYINEKNSRKGEITRKPEGIKGIISRLYNENSADMYNLYLTKVDCPMCNGERLSKTGRMVTINGLRYPTVASFSFKEMLNFCEHLENNLTVSDYEKVSSNINSIKEICNASIKLGIDYLNINRQTSTLSGGEKTRLKLLSAYTNHLSGILYIFDEPSKGLSEKDYDNVIDMLRKLKNENNTILLVEHNIDMIKHSDYLIELGPKSGINGGNIVASGEYEEVCNNTKTEINKLINKTDFRIRGYGNDFEYVYLSHLNKINLKDINFKFPKNALTCISGRSGSGKSTLLKEEIYTRFSKNNAFSDVILVDQSGIGKTNKSVVATFTKIMDILRVVMASTVSAKNNGMGESYFSFNSELGKCKNCNGSGYIKVQYLENEYVKCLDCKGKRFNKDVLSVKFRGLSVDEILNLQVKEARDFFSDNDKIARILDSLMNVGLDYLSLGQRTSTLSGGEAARLKLANELLNKRKSNTLFLLDEPTTGLHYSDINNIIMLLSDLISEGNTIIAIEHNKQFLANADYLVELGPGAGEDGGEIVYEKVVSYK